MDHSELRSQIEGSSLDDIYARISEIEDGTKETLPFDIEKDREAGLDSPYHFATQTVDPFYYENFEHRHIELLDECLAPWVLGETVRIQGKNYEPSDFVGLIVLWPRSTFKSSAIRLLLNWAYPYFKIKRNEDLTAMLIHKIQQKAIDHGEGIRNCAKFNERFRDRYPEFAVDGHRDWDSKDHWRWPHMTWQARQAGLWSFTAYGESSSKVGGHYMLRLFDDWEDEETVGSTESIVSSERKLKMLENLKVRGRKHNPWVGVGTYYHYDGVYKRLERSGGWLSWVVPAHEGSSKAIFDLVGLDRRTDEGLAKIESGLLHLEKTRSQDLNFPKLLPWRELYMAALGQRTDDDGEFDGGFYQYSCQIQLDPVPSGLARFDHDALNSAWVADIPGPDSMWLHARIDPAIGTRKRNCETALVIGGVVWNGDRIVVRTWLGQEKRPTLILRRAFNWIIAFQKLGYHFVNLGIEAVAFQEAMAESAREGVPIRDAAFDGEKVPVMFPPCEIVKIRRGPNQTKPERIIEMDGPISRRELWFWERDAQGHKLHKQFLQYPHDRDDGLEAVHDLWVKTEQPPAPLGSVARPRLTPEEILDKLGMRPKSAHTMGLSNSVRLASRR